jgi:hypothetical protein
MHPKKLLLDWIDRSIDRYSPQGPWRVSAGTLQRYLLEHPTIEDAARVFGTPHAVGQQLRNLAKLFPHRFRGFRTETENVWQIKRDPTSQIQITSSQY